MCKNLMKVEIPPNSNLQTIESNAFSSSNIEEIYFPMSLRELKRGWYHGANKLNKITISPSNGQFIIKEDKYLIGKTDPNSEEFNNLLFAVRNIDVIFIPSSIKIISSYAFYSCDNLFIPSKVSKICEDAFHYCEKLTKVEISPNSNLQIIGSNAFSETEIEVFLIPPKVSEICENAFFDCIKI